MTAVPRSGASPPPAAPKSRPSNAARSSGRAGRASPGVRQSRCRVVGRLLGENEVRCASSTHGGPTYAGAVSRRRRRSPQKHGAALRAALRNRGGRDWHTRGARPALRASRNSTHAVEQSQCPAVWGAAACRAAAYHPAERPCTRERDGRLPCLHVDTTACASPASCRRAICKRGLGDGPMCC